MNKPDSKLVGLNAENESESINDFEENKCNRSNIKKLMP